MTEEKKMQIKKNPKLFEYDKENDIVDIFVRKDPDCPFPFYSSEEKWFHQGFYLNEFILFTNDLFKRYDLPYKILNYEERKYEKGFNIMMDYWDSLPEKDACEIDEQLIDLGL